MAKFTKEREKREKVRNEVLAENRTKETLTGKGATTKRKELEAKRKQEQAAVHKARETAVGLITEDEEEMESVVMERMILVADKEGRDVRRPPKGTVTRNRKPIVKKGRRKMPVPCDDHGCQHMGIAELKELPKDYLKSYIKEGNWLEKKPCKDCAAKPDDTDGVRVMDVATILSSNGEPSDDMARYCNYGSVAHTMDDDEEFKHKFTCDMILCKACYRKRSDKYEEEEQNKTNTRSSRRRKRRS
jgi:hypothetical protein